MTSSLGAGLLWFVAIIVAIPVVLWLLKRTPYGAAMGASAAAAGTRTVASLAIGPHQRIVTVEVGQGDERRWLVLGVTPQSITTLHTLSAQDEPAAVSARAMPPIDFAALLNKVRHARR
jgi:flagellar protein FliO/FliZ